MRLPSGPTSGRAAQDDLELMPVEAFGLSAVAAATEQIQPVPQGISALVTYQTRFPSGDQDGLIVWSCVE